jgi:hypothetical protein
LGCGVFNGVFVAPCRARLMTKASRMTKAHLQQPPLVDELLGAPLQLGAQLAQLALVPWGGGWLVGLGWVWLVGWLAWVVSLG